MPTTYKSIKNITRFDYGRTAFEGWRLCVAIRGTNFVRYFPDKKLGGPTKALRAAKTALKEIREATAEDKINKRPLSAATKAACIAILDKYSPPEKQ